MKTKKLILHFILIMFLFSCHSQSHEKGTSNANDIEKKVNTFLIDKGYDSKDVKKIYSLIEIVESEKIEINSVGIYRLAIHTSHTPIYILLKDSKSIKILDLENFAHSIYGISLFLKENNINNKKTEKYLEAILKQYKNNKSISNSGILIQKE